MELTDIINKIIADSYKNVSIDEEYQDNFSNEGDRKATYIIDDLKYKESNGEVIINALCYLSIGGADGSEIEKILTATEIKKGILIEISDAAAERAREKAKQLSALGKELIVLQGDASEKLDDALSVVERFVKKDMISGLVVSAQAVLHELPKRSKSYNLPIFLGKLYREPKLDYCLFYSREPCEPKGWTERVRLRIEKVSNEDLFRFTCHVRDRLKITGDPQKLSSNWLNVESILAIESLHKLLRNNTLKRIEYELGEQLTEFNPFDVKKTLENSVEGMKVSIEYLITVGFKRALIENKVEYFGHNSELLPIPQTHVEIIGFKGKNRRPILETPNPPSLTNKENINKLPVNFSNPFDGQVSNEQISKWLSQFENDEVSIIVKLLENFQFFSTKKIREQCKNLYIKIQQQYKDTDLDFLFVPFGRTAKSSSIISYYFRDTNQIPDEKFRSFEELTSINLDDKIIVFLDDLLASGHQAFHYISKIHSKIPNKLCLAVLVACEQGVEYLFEKSNVDIIYSFDIKRIDSPLDENSIIFPNQHEREKAKAIIIKYGKKGTYLNPFGYAGTSLLLGFDYNTPDNTFPLFWSDSETYTSLFKKIGTGRESPNDSFPNE